MDSTLFETIFIIAGLILLILNIVIAVIFIQFLLSLRRTVNFLDSSIKQITEVVRTVKLSSSFARVFKKVTNTLSGDSPRNGKRDKK